MTKRANGDGRPYYDKSKDRWYVQIEAGRGPNGKRKRKKVGGKTPKEARQAAVRARQAVELGLPVADTRRSVVSFLDWWRDSVMPGRVSEGSADTYKRALRLYVIPHVGHFKLVELTPAHVTEMLRAMEAQGLSASTQSLARRVLGNALRRAEQEGLVVRNVAHIADGPRLNRTSTRPLSEVESKQFIGALKGHRLEVASLIQLTLGLRRGEALGLSWNDVDLDSSPATLVITQQLQRRTGQGLVLVPPKAKSARRLPVPDVVAKALKSHRTRQATERLAAGPLWCNEWNLVSTTEFGKPIDPDNYRHKLGKLAEDAGIGHIGTHVLRHSAGSSLFALGIPMKVISEVLGHSNTRTTEDIYVHVRDAARMEVAEAINRASRGG
jgi:integrase